MWEDLSGIGKSLDSAQVDWLGKIHLGAVKIPGAPF